MFVIWVVGVISIATLAGSALPATYQGKNDMTALVRGNNAFAFDLYGKLREGNGNLFFSPYSISTALAMTYAGAREQTAAEMAKTLHFAVDQEHLPSAYQSLLAAVNGKGKPRSFQLYTANALWGQKGYYFQPDFLKLTQDYYGGSLREVDFRNATEQARQIINRWVEEQTNNKIQELLKPGAVQPTTPLVLTNAIYFKAAWMEEFWEAATKPEAFHLTAEKEAKVPMMHKTEACNFLDDSEFQMLALPYERHQLSLLVLLPKKVDGLADLEKSLSAEKLEGWLPKMKSYQVEISLPKFKMTASFELKDVLSALGMPMAFSPRADFTGITTTPPGIMIGQVIHKAYVDVNEKGTEAAAATAVVALPKGVPAQPPLRAVFRADHPFVFAIRDNQTGSILFLGRVTNPQG